MSLAIKFLRYEWKITFWMWMNDSELVQQTGEDQKRADREYMRASAAEIVRLKRLEARVKELEMETEALQVQRAQAKHDARK